MTRGVLIALDQMFLSGCDWCEADLLDGYFQMQNCQGDSRPVTDIGVRIVTAVEESRAESTNRIYNGMTCLHQCHCFL
jgi:hypothetical protein